MMYTYNLICLNTITARRLMSLSFLARRKGSGEYMRMHSSSRACVLSLKKGARSANAGFLPIIPLHDLLRVPTTVYCGALLRHSRMMDEPGRL